MIPFSRALVMFFSRTALLTDKSIMPLLLENYFGLVRESVVSRQAYSTIMMMCHPKIYHIYPAVNSKALKSVQG
jgi:hypothetical protein